MYNIAPRFLSETFLLGLAERESGHVRHLIRASSSLVDFSLRDTRSRENT